MAISVSLATDDDLDRWDDLVARSPQGTPFHLRGFLEVLAEHSGATLHPLIGYKGQEPIGLFPGFEISKGPLSTVFSPPPNRKIPYLGPVLLNQDKPKRRKAERAHREFIDQALDTLGDGRRVGYTLVRGGPAYTDVRPFLWRGFETVTEYTYSVDLSVGEAALRSSFSSDARSNIQAAEDAACSIEEGGTETIEAVITQLQRRHAEQGEHFGVTPAFVTDLFDRLPPGTLRPYRCTVEGEFAGGMIVLEFGDTAYRWQGGAKTGSIVGGNDFLDWTIMRTAMERGLDRYDMVGANNERLTDYKAKFDPNLGLYLSVQNGTRSMNLIASIYKRLR